MIARYVTRLLVELGIPEEYARLIASDLRPGVKHRFFLRQAARIARDRSRQVLVLPGDQFDDWARAATATVLVVKPRYVIVELRSKVWDGWRQIVTYPRRHYGGTWR